MLRPLQNLSQWLLIKQYILIIFIHHKILINFEIFYLLTSSSDVELQPLYESYLNSSLSSKFAML